MDNGIQTNAIYTDIAKAFDGLNIGSCWISHRATASVDIY